MSKEGKKFEEHSRSVADSIAMLPRQLQESWRRSRQLKLPASYRKATNVVFCGMGGSNLASELIRGLFVDEIRLPFVLVRDYDLPKFVNKDSLVVISSYSGNTEETISCLKQAIKLKAKIICISAGGKIRTIAKRHGLPVAEIDAKLNPSGQPRYAVGSQLGAALAALDVAGVISVSDATISKTVRHLEKLNGFFATSSYGNRNLPRNSAKKIKGRFPIIMAAEFLAPCGHILANQINESAKTLAVHNAIPELNHHLMEGLELPKEVIRKLKVMFLDSKLYPHKISNRFKVTKQILKKKGIAFLSHSFDGPGKFNATLEALQFGSWFSFYLSQINHKDPTLIPWVDYFKARLQKMK